MKPVFALSLSFEGITLFYRAADGWRIVGDVAADSANLAEDLAALRSKAERLRPAPMRCKVILPDDQIRYLTVQTGPLMGDAQRALIEAELEGATPYTLQELAFDVELGSGHAFVAAAAKETLAEAEAFATEHGFEPVSFVGNPANAEFGGKEPFFGLSELAEAKEDKDPLVRDQDAMAIVGMAQIPAAEPTPQPEPEPAPQTAPEPVAEAKDQVPEPAVAAPTTPTVVTKAAPATKTAEPVQPKETNDSSGQDVQAQDAVIVVPPMPGFASRRKRATEGAPTLETPSRDMPPSPQPKKAAETPPKAAEHAPPPAAPKAAPTPQAKPQPPAALQRALAVSAAAQVSQPAASSETTTRAKSPATTKVKRPTSLSTGLPSLRGLVGGRKPAQPPASATRAAPPTHATQIAPKLDETERMTVFGMRQEQKIGGKPRFLGVMLTSALVLFLAAAATWAALFSEGPIGRLFGRAPLTETEQPTAPATESTPTTPAETSPAQPSDAGQVPLVETAPATPDTEQTALLSPDAGDQTESEGFSATDSAVIDALREPLGQDAIDAEDPSVSAATDTSPNAARYAATGIWPVAPDVPQTPSVIGIGDLYLASIDRTDLGQTSSDVQEPIALDTDTALDAVANPAAAETRFDLDDRGLVRPTANGALTPDGITVFLGKPSVVPPARPDRPDPEVATEEQTLSPEQARLAGFRPKQRPKSVEARAADAKPAAPTAEEQRLAKLRPQVRPAAIAALAKPAPEPTPEPTPEAKPEPEVAKPTAPVVAAPANPALAGKRPNPRPKNFKRTVARTQKKQSQDGASGARAASLATGREDTGGGSTRIGRTGGQKVSNASVKPAGRSPSSVTRQATLKNSINLKRLNLIGVYGTPSNRRALIRLPNGRYKKVKVGDLVDGGRVVAIGDSELRYQKGNRSQTLKMPKG